MKHLASILLLFGFIGFSQNPNCNCCTEEYDQFDFWLGDWEVSNPSGNVVGTNSIKKIQGNCVLQENWIGGNGSFTGTSYNFYNKQTGFWEQIWLDSGGSNLHLIGKRNGNQMILESKPLKNIEGKEYFHRITWTKNDNGTVRQLWETITEGEETKIAFDGMYSKKNQ